MKGLDGEFGWVVLLLGHVLSYADRPLEKLKFAMDAERNLEWLEGKLPGIAGWSSISMSMIEKSAVGAGDEGLTYLACESE